MSSLQEILVAIPNHPPALLLLAMARRRLGEPAAALEVLEPLLNAQHKWAAAWFERGASLGLLGRGDEAIEALLKAVEFQPEHPEAWRVLADHLMATGDVEAADSAYARHIKCSTRDPLLQEAAAAMIQEGRCCSRARLEALPHGQAHRRGGDTHAGRGRGAV